MNCRVKSEATDVFYIHQMVFCSWLVVCRWLSVGLSWMLCMLLCLAGSSNWFYCVLIVLVIHQLLVQSVYGLGFRLGCWGLLEVGLVYPLQALYTHK